MRRRTADALLFAGRGSLFGIPMPIIVFAGAALVMHVFLSRTSIGRFIYAQGDNPEAARLSGIALRPLTMLEHVLVALFAWLAGLVWIGQTGSMQTNIVIMGTQIFDVILVVVLGGISLVGGRGGVFSVVVGCALIGTLLNAFTIMDVNTEVQNIIRGVVLLRAPSSSTTGCIRATKRPRARATDFALSLVTVRGLAAGECRRALLDEMRHPFLEIFRAKRCDHLLVGDRPGFRERLEIRLENLPFDDADRARR